MELPDDVVEHIRGYAKPSKYYKMYASIEKILFHGMFRNMRDYLRRKLKKATQTHFDRFLPLFLEMEKSEVELTASQNAFWSKHAPASPPSPERMEYYFQIRNFTLKRRELISQLKEL